MKANSQFQKIISVLLIFILLTELSGCVSYVRFMQISDVPLSDSTSSDNSYVICGLRSGHFPKYKSYNVRNISISDGCLTAYSDPGANRSWNYYTIYVSSDSLIKVTSDNIVRVALNDIYKVKAEEINWYLFWGYTAAALLSISLILALISGVSHSGNGI